MQSLSSVEEIQRARRAHGPATVLAIGTANPSNCIQQDTYPDYYFRVTNSEHMLEVKEKFKRMCTKSGIKQRYMYLTEKILKENPSMCGFNVPSLDARQDILVSEVPKLGQEAARKAIDEWGQTISSITHLVFCTTGGVDMPGADYQLIQLLGLNPSVKRHMMYQQGCYAGVTVLRIAKDLAENNAGARVLVVCSEITAVTFKGPSETHFDSLLAQALFSDGAADLVVGSDPVVNVEKPIFQLVFTAQTIVPNSYDAMNGHVRETGVTCKLSKDIPELITNGIDVYLKDAYSDLGEFDWNSMFWVVHPGGPKVLNLLEHNLGLDPVKLECTRRVLNDYGNMSNVAVLFILDEMRRTSHKQGLKSTGEGHEWGYMCGFGPGLTIETMLLHSVPI